MDKTKALKRIHAYLTIALSTIIAAITIGLTLKPNDLDGSSLIGQMFGYALFLTPPALAATGAITLVVYLGMSIKALIRREKNTQLRSILLSTLNLAPLLAMLALLIFQGLADETDPESLAALKQALGYYVVAQIVVSAINAAYASLLLRDIKRLNPQS